MSSFPQENISFLFDPNALYSNEQIFENFSQQFTFKSSYDFSSFWFPFDVNEAELLKFLQYQNSISYKYGATRSPWRQFGYISL